MSQTLQELLVQAVVAALVSSGVITFIAGLLLRRHSERIAAEVRRVFERRKMADDWKEQSLSQLLGPVLMQLDRTRRAFQRYRARNVYLEFEIL
jgi:hypothetical protein